MIHEDDPQPHPSTQGNVEPIDPTHPTLKKKISKKIRVWGAGGRKGQLRTPDIEELAEGNGVHLRCPAQTGFPPASASASASAPAASPLFSPRVMDSRES